MSAPELPTPLAPLRTDLITTAVNFLNDPQVKSAPLSKRLAFLEGKGLTQEEIDLAIIKSNSGLSNTQPSINNITSNTPSQSNHQASSGYKGLILTTAVVLGASSLLISNYQTIKSFTVKLFNFANDDDDNSEIKKLECEFKQSIQELKNLMEEKEKKLQATLEDLLNKQHE